MTDIITPMRPEALEDIAESVYPVTQAMPADHLGFMVMVKEIQDATANAAKMEAVKQIMLYLKEHNQFQIKGKRIKLLLSHNDYAELKKKVEKCIKQ